MGVSRRLLLQTLAPAALLGRHAWAAAQMPPIRIGLLRFGTVAWEIDVMGAHGLNAAPADITEYASSPATQVALQAHEVDMVALDWLWVARQRAAGADWTFAPLSSAVGAIIVPKDSPIRSVADLAGRKLGIAGTPIDKSWLILRAYASKVLGLDIDAKADKSFAAPPLLAQELAAGRIDAALTFWPYAAKAEAAGARAVIGVGEMLAALGLPAGLPMVGYVFSEAWARRRSMDVYGFLNAAATARAILAKDDAEWQRLRPVTGAQNDAELLRLRDWYRSGIVPTGLDAASAAGVSQLYSLLHEVGGDALTGPAPTLPDGTFWPP